MPYSLLARTLPDPIGRLEHSYEPPLGCTELVPRRDLTGSLAGSDRGGGGFRMQGKPGADGL